MAFLAPLIEGGFTLGLIALLIGLGASLRLIYSWGYISVFGDTMELVGVYRVLPKMRMTIPKEIAERMNLREGDKLVVYYDEENQRMVVEKWRKK
ncbi:MAG: AbrB/MazE/SpoVT family DNA-binding domain-containing protein [Desulfurococcales archaeon]|nr:AbrB/MazE/SpoVT family DNA-binding domain-containing protein [Desulfurococcales archaeon]